MKVIDLHEWARKRGKKMALISTVGHDDKTEWCPKCERKAGRFPFLIKAGVKFCRKCGFKPKPEEEGWLHGN